ncbi:MAG: response regulator [Elusimicrobia bacterium]|nr:response regulator [Elusimicrobiota bacterium]
MKRKLLVVDDDPVIRRLIRRSLQEAGYEVIEAADGDVALELVRSEHPALVLLDMHMPKFDGIATLDAIRESNPEIGIIMITGDGDEKRAKWTMSLGACDFLTKPFEVEALKTTVMANLLLRRAAPDA